MSPNQMVPPQPEPTIVEKAKEVIGDVVEGAGELVEALPDLADIASGVLDLLGSLGD